MNSRSGLDGRGVSSEAMGGKYKNNSHDVIQVVPMAIHKEPTCVDQSVRPRRKI